MQREIVIFYLNSFIVVKFNNNLFFMFVQLNDNLFCKRLCNIALGGIFCSLH